MKKILTLTVFLFVFVLISAQTSFGQLHGYFLTPKPQPIWIEDEGEFVSDYVVIKSGNEITVFFKKTDLGKGTEKIEKQVLKNASPEKIKKIAPKPAWPICLAASDGIYHREFKRLSEDYQEKNDSLSAKLKRAEGEKIFLQNKNNQLETSEKVETRIIIFLFLLFCIIPIIRRVFIKR